MRGLKKSKCLPGILLGFVFILLIPFNVFAADVDVYAEGAYTDTDLVLYIYADINSGPILSFGINIGYPAGLTFQSATKNESTWFFGDGTPEYPYMNPENSDTGGTGPGNVIIIGGKLDTSAATAGVTGPRVLLGTVTFTHSGVTDFSGVTLTYGRGNGTGDYKNFVGTDKTVYDSADMTGVSFAVGIYERGDANGDGMVNNIDMGEVRNIILGRVPGVIYRVYADANGDGQVTNIDMGEVRKIILGIN